MSKTDYWVRDFSGAKAFVVGVDERDVWGARGWLVADEPNDRDLVWMHKPELDQPGLIAWGAREYWQGIGWTPGTPPVPINPTKDPALTDVAAELPPDGNADAVTEWVGTDPQRAEKALVAELTRPKPRKTIVDALQNVGQPQETTPETVTPS